MSVQILPIEIRDRIAAGEVVERPASAVKELLENAIDAGAHAVSVEVRNGGLALIRVADDGHGMDRDDASMALERFSTSKIAALEDLERIRTLGFRGEALSSIAAVARVEIVTRADHVLEGTRVTAHHGSEQAMPAASPVGTSVSVYDLFAELPARRRFLKSRLRETEPIHQVVLRYAIAYPETAFRLIVDGRERLVAAQSTPLGRISTLLGRETAAEMVSVQWQALDIRVAGFVSRPTIGRSRRDRQFFFVNRRPVRAGLLAVMLERPYTGRLPPGRHPVAVLDITIDPWHVDVNVHPQKAEVRFSQERSIYGAVSSAVAAALQDYPRQIESGAGPWPFDLLGSYAPELVREGSASYVSSELRAVGQLHNTYVLAQTMEGLVIADQHAAHEQVLFERLTRSEPPVSLSPPFRLELTRSEMTAADQILETLGDLGVEAEPFGERTLLVRSLPACLMNQNPGELITVLLEEAMRREDARDEMRERLAMKAACVGAIKAGDALTGEQMQVLLDDLAQAWSPVVCPHGRPALVSISMEELARRFGR